MRKLLASVLSVVLFGAGYASSVHAAGDSWLQSDSYWRTDAYGTDFYAQAAMWYDLGTYPPAGAGVYVWRNYLRMDVIYTDASEYLNCDSNDVNSSANPKWERNWYNSPFPLNYYNTPTWDYFTYDGVRILTASSQFGASRNEQCNLGYAVPVGAWWSKSSGSPFYYGAW